MNKVVLMGRVARDIELIFAKGTGNGIAKFSLAVQRPFKKDEVDFINIVAFGKQAETLATYVTKGQRLLIEGAMQVSNYTDKDGNKRNNVDVVVNSFEFIEKAEKFGGAKPLNEGSNNLSMDDLTPDDDGDCPF